MNEEIKNLITPNNKDFTALSNEMIEFIDSFGSVIISSDLGEHCVASYAPFVREEDEIYIIISQIAKHYKSIKDFPNKVQIIFLQDEISSSSIFARKRASFRVEAKFIENKADYIGKFESKFADEVPFLIVKQMGDFHIVRLKLCKGRFVKSFGAAFEIDGLKVIKQIGEGMPHKI